MPLEPLRGNMLILMCGLPFSGKSTLARAIAERTGCEYISLDEINKERGLGFGGDGIPVEAWEETHSIALSRLRHLLPDADVILDDTCCYRWIRDRYRALAGEFGLPTRVVHLDIPAEIVSLRRRDNLEKRARGDVRDDIFDKVAESFEIPGDDESVIVFDGSVPLQEWLARLNWR
jgi:predicted kinase